MTSHDHHGHDGKHNHGHPHGGHGKPLHHDWRLWVAVVLMLVAMAAYVLSNNEEFQPGNDGKPGQPVPAAPAPAAP